MFPRAVLWFWSQFDGFVYVTGLVLSGSSIGHEQRGCSQCVGVKPSSWSDVLPRCASVEKRRCSNFLQLSLGDVLF